MIELRPNKDLLDVNFSGYKLSLNSVPSYQHDLEEGVGHVLPSDEQYSYLHLKVFSLHNHLYGDPWSPDDVYFIDKSWKVKKNITDVKSGQLKGVKEVWTVPMSNLQPVAGHYNPSLSFPAAEMAVVADGTGVLHILKTAKRSSWQPELWEKAFSGEVCGAATPFVIADTRLCNAERELHCVLLHIEEAPEGLKEEQSCTRFQSTVSWLVFSQSETSSWTVLHCYKLACLGELDYLALEENGKALYAACEHGIKFIFDSEPPVETEQKALKPVSARGDGEKNGIDKEEKKQYMWQQSSEDIEINFILSPNVQKNEVVVESEEKNINIRCKERILLSGDTWGCIDPSLTSWTLQNGKLQVTITKGEPGQMWQKLVLSNCHGEEVMDPALVEEVHQRLAHLCSETQVTDVEQSSSFNSEQLEECDAGRSNSLLVRLDPLSCSVTHQANLGGHHALFCARLAPDASPALCLRHDVDGCVWQPAAPALEMDSAANTASSWPISHIGTFHAFGYVQASKAQKKFTLCPPDLSFVTVCDASRHIYVYRQPTAISGELRNRRTGQKVSHSSQQQLFALSNDAEVLGAHASNHWLYVLTSNYLLALHVNP